MEQSNIPMAKTVENDKSITFSNYQDFRKWTENQEGYWFLLRGVPMPSPSPSRLHQEISKRIEMILFEAVEKKALGKVYYAPLDVKLSSDTVYQPDLFVVLKHHAERLRPTHVEGAPDLVVEILSPGTAKLDLVDKRYDYAAAGVSEYWIVDPDTATVEVYVLQSGQLSLRSSARGTGEIAGILIPDLRINLTDLFANL
jgi:Uma2 family endonuclease